MPLELQWKAKWKALGRHAAACMMRRACDVAAGYHARVDYRHWAPAAARGRGAAAPPARARVAIVTTDL